MYVTFGLLNLWLTISSALLSSLCSFQDSPCFPVMFYYGVLCVCGKGVQARYRAEQSCMDMQQITYNAVKSFKCVSGATKILYLYVI